MDCRQVKQEEVVERYLLGQLSESEQEAFEQHYFECPRCLEELETYRALRDELSRRAAEIRAEPARAPAPLVWRWAPAVAGAAAAVALIVWLWPRPAPPGPTPPVAQAQPAVSLDAALVELAKVEPPAYTPVILRGATDEAGRRFRDAMTHYQKGDYAAALPGLRQAAWLDPARPDVHFYLGACYLLTGADKEAIASLKSAVGLGDTPYLEDARLYLAKAYLRTRDLAAARGELEQVVRLASDREEEARRLLEQLEALTQAPR